MRELEFVFYSGGLKENRDVKELLGAGAVKGRLQEFEGRVVLVYPPLCTTHLPDLYDFCRVEIE